jgi:hypothetical protein
MALGQTDALHLILGSLPFYLQYCQAASKKGVSAVIAFALKQTTYQNVYD